MIEEMNRKCPICSTEQRQSVAAELMAGYKVIVCEQCSVKYLSPIPPSNNISEHYDKYYLTLQRDDREPALIESHSGVLQYLVSHAVLRDNLSFLEFGFGSGYFLKLLAERGYRAFGVDLGSNNCIQMENYARQKQVNLSILKLNERTWVELEGLQFNVITMFQVIEHLSDPLRCLRELASLQSKDDLIYIECPNNDATYLKIKNVLNSLTNRAEHYYDSLKVPEHIFGFNKRSMGVILKEAGYEVVDIGDYYYADGIHQVETMFWWPPFRANKKLLSLRGFTNSLIQFSDQLFSRFLNAGGGLFALARKL